jgi:phosphopantothenate-cysteine ligase
MTTVPVTVSSEPILDNGQGVIDPDVYFQINKSPADLPEFESKLSAFIDYHQEKNNKVVFITVSYSYCISIR